MDFDPEKLKEQITRAAGLLGMLGGKQAAANMSDDERHARARKAGKARHAKKAAKA